MIAAGVALAAPTPADNNQDAFLSAVNRAGIGYADNNPDLTAQLGRARMPHAGRTG